MADSHLRGRFERWLVGQRFAVLGAPNPHPPWGGIVGQILRRPGGGTAATAANPESRGRYVSLEALTPTEGMVLSAVHISSRQPRLPSRSPRRPAQNRSISSATPGRVIRSRDTRSAITSPARSVRQLCGS